MSRFHPVPPEITWKPNSIVVVFKKTTRHASCGRVELCLRYVFKNNIYARLDVWLLASQQYSKWVGEPD